MAVLISKQNTDITTNEFYRVEAYQLGTFGTTVEALSTARQIAVTFANAGNCQGIVIQLRTNLTDAVVTPYRSVTVELQEFVASVWTTRASKTLATAEIITGTNPAGRWLVPFEFSVPYTVTTSAGVWRFNIVSAAGVATRHWEICKTGTGTDRYIYASWCDTQLTPVSGSDFIIFKNYVDITTSFAFKAYLGVADSARAYCAWVCRNLDPTPDNVAYARVPGTIASLVTLTLDGLFVLSSHGGFMAGTESNPIGADLCKIELRVPTLGTSVSAFSDAAAFGAGGAETARQSLFFYGVYPAKKIALSTNARTVGTTTIDVDDPTVFTINDFILIGKRSSNNTDESGTPRYRITGITGNTLTFTPSLANANSLVGARIIKTYNNTTNNTGYGVSIRRVGSTVGYGFIYTLGIMSNLICHGVFFELCWFHGSNNAGSVEDTAYNLGYQFKDCLMLNNTALNNYAASHSNFMFLGAMPISTIVIRNCIFTRQGFSSGLVYGNITSGSPTVSYAGGSFNMYNIIFMRIANNGTINSGISAAILQDNDGIYIDSIGAGRTGLNIGGVNSTWKNIEIWGAVCGVGGDAGALRINGLINGIMDNIKVNNSTVAFNFEGVSTSSTISNVTLGNETTNTWDIANNGRAFADIAFKTVIGNPTIDTTGLLNASPQTRIHLENRNATNADFIYTPTGYIIRTGTGLSDVTVHNGSYAMRFQSTSSTSLLTWSQTLPTGNIQNQIMSIGVWVNIASSSYWAGVHELPRLTIIYDSSTTVYAEATQTTGWQYISTSFTPLTTTNTLTSTLSTKTDATGSFAYAYWDDFTVTYPTSHELDLTKLEDWNNGEPMNPTLPITGISGNNIFIISE